MASISRNVTQEIGGKRVFIFLDALSFIQIKSLLLDCEGIYGGVGGCDGFIRVIGKGHKTFCFSFILFLSIFLFLFLSYFTLSVISVPLCLSPFVSISFSFFVSLFFSLPFLLFSSFYLFISFSLSLSQSGNITTRINMFGFLHNAK